MEKNNGIADKELRVDVAREIHRYYQQMFFESRFVAFLSWMNIIVTVMVLTDANVRIEQAFALMVFALGWAVYNSGAFYLAHKQFKAVKSRVSGPNEKGKEA